MAERYDRDEFARRLRMVACAASCLAMTVAVHAGEDWKPVTGQPLTRWAADVRPNRVLPEYPRPQLARKDWQNLNGPWQYAITPADREQAPDQYDGEILVPFCIESALSGVKKAIGADEALWYRRTFEVPPQWNGRRVRLNFGAVDWFAQVWVNGTRIGEHRGGYDPFTFDITDALAGEGPQTIVVKVIDPTDTNWQPRGKQVLHPHSIWYTAVTGIWQTVWIEPVPEQYIRRLRIVPDVQQSKVVVAAEITGGGAASVQVRDGDSVVATADLPAGKPTAIAIPNVKLWSPDSPHLYTITVTVKETSAGKRADTVESYFGMREISLGQYHGHTRILLNGRPLFQFGPLDQGWWPDGLYTAPTDEALRSDLEVLKRLGMNMLRKHVKVEPARYYYHCDRLGLLVWQDMPSGDRYIGPHDPDIRRTPESGANFERELAAMIDALENHPSIVTWVVYNEGWGQWDTERMASWVKQRDPTRLVDADSGWADRGAGDMIDAHIYPGPGMRPPEEKRASVLGEFGGLGWPVADHLWRTKDNWGYRTYHSRDELQAHYLELINRLPTMIGAGLSAAVYTQTSDVEGEVNGLMTYDREVLKLDAEAAANAHRRLYLPPPEEHELVPTSETSAQTWKFTTERPADAWIEPEFDDSAWKSGEGMFGSKDTPGVHVGTEWTTPEIWLRRTFRLDPMPKGDLRLRVYHDEDAEIYINGVQAATLGGYVTSHVLTELSDDAKRALHAGVNTIAVHCKQTTGGQGVDVGLSIIVPGAE